MCTESLNKTIPKEHRIRLLFSFSNFLQCKTVQQVVFYSCRANVCMSCAFKYMVSWVKLSLISCIRVIFLYPISILWLLLFEKSQKSKSKRKFKEDQKMTNIFLGSEKPNSVSGGVQMWTDRQNRLNDNYSYQTNSQIEWKKFHRDCTFCLQRWA